MLIKILHCTGGSSVVSETTAAAVIRYSMALPQLHEMATATPDDAEVSEPGSQLVLVVGHGVALAAQGVRSPEGILDPADNDGDIDDRTEDLTPLPALIGSDTDAPYDYDYDLELSVLQQGVSETITSACSVGTTPPLSSTQLSW